MFLGLAAAKEDGMIRNVKINFCQKFATTDDRRHITIKTTFLAPDSNVNNTKHLPISERLLNFVCGHGVTHFSGNNVKLKDCDWLDL